MQALFNKHSIIYLNFDKNLLIKTAQGLLFSVFGIEKEFFVGKSADVFLSFLGLDSIVLLPETEIPCKVFFVFDKKNYFLTIEKSDDFHLFVSPEKDIDERVFSEENYPSVLSEEDFGNIIYLNEKSKTYFDCRQGRKLKDFFVFDFECENLISKVRKNGNYQSLVHIKTASGEYKRAVCSLKTVKRNEDLYLQALWHFEGTESQSRHTWEEMLLFVPDIFLRTDKNLNILYANHSIYRVERRELPGLNLREVLDEDTVKIIEKNTEKIEGDAPVHFEHQIRFDQNRRFNFNCLISQHTEEYVFVVNNFVAAIEKDAFFHNSNENIYFLLEAFPDNIFILDTNLSIKAYHLSQRNSFFPETKDIFDFHVGKIFGKSFAKSISEIISQRDSRFMAEFKSFNFEYTTREQTFYLEARVSRVNKERFILILRDVTDERKALKKIEQQREDYYELLRSIDEYFYSFSVSGECFVSSRVTEVLGYTREDFEGTPIFWLRLVHKEDRYKVLNALKNIIHTKSSITLSYRVKEKKSDFYHWIVDKVKVKYDENGVFKGIFGVAKDVSLQKKLINQNQLFSALIESSHDLIAMTDNTGRISFINKNGLKFLQARHRDAVTDRNLMDYLVIDDAEGFFQRLQKKIEDGKALNFETVLFATDKQNFIHADVTVFALNGDALSKEKETLAFIIKDTSEKNEAKIALQNSQLRFKSLVEAMDAGIFVVNNFGEIEFTNKKMKYFLRNNELELLGMEVYDDTKTNESGTLPEEWKKIQEHPEEIVMKGENEDDIWVILSYVPVENEKNEKNGYMGIMTDITEIKKTEVNLKEVNKELEQLLYSASHDLKGPISSTQGLVNLMKMELNNPDVDYYANMMHDSLKKLENSVFDLLKVSTVKQGNIELKLVNVKELVEDILQTYGFHPNIERVNVRLNFNAQRPFYSDSSLLRTIFQNLIDNALKYAKPPGFECFVNVEVKDTPKGIMVKVEDNGIGIPKAFHEKIFEMFFRGTQFAKGSGLGLFIVSSAVKRLGGQILVESEEHIGTTFWVKIPTGLPS